MVPAPMSQETSCKIMNYNEHLVKWAETNGVIVVNTSPVFTLSAGDVDGVCFNADRDTTPHIVNRFGVIRLLDAADSVQNSRCAQTGTRAKQCL